MPQYSYRCPNNAEHTVDLYYSYGKYPQTHECVFEGCEGEMYRIIGAVHFSIDNVDKANMSFTLGREFSNKQELKAYMDANGLRHMEESEFAEDVRKLDQERELKRELASKGIDYRTHLAEQQAAKRSAAQEKLKKLGIKVGASKPVTEEEANSSAWEETVSQDYIDHTKPIYDKKGEHIGFKGKKPSAEKRLEVKQKFQDVVVNKNYAPYAAKA